jgi:methylmalonyl-CoA/ethylmalonyl-CoA epimerase
MEKIEHIRIAKDLKVSNLIFEKLFGTPAYKWEEVESEGFRPRFLKTDQIK